jgi:glycosyltransferase involved in cell wall biosynthesis
MRKNGTTPILHFVNILGIGGAEGQFVERVRSTDFRRWRPLVAALKKSGPHLAEFQRLGLEPKEFPLAGSFAHPATLATVVRLAAWMRMQGVKLVHAQDFYTNLIAVPAARLAGAKVIVSRLDLAHWHGPRRRQALSWVTRLADRVQVNAFAIRRQLIEEEGISPDKIEVVLNGIDLDRFDRRHKQPLAAQLPIPDGARLVTVVANLHPVKGQHDVVEALAGIAGRFPDLHLVCVGEGERRQPIEERARELGVADRVHLVGHRTDIPAILARTGILISSSYAEGLSNSVIEGMAAKLPVIATAVGGSPELVADGERGLLVPPRAPARIADALTRLLEDAALRERLGAAARRYVEANLEIGTMARHFDRLYEATLGGGPVQRPTNEPLRATA